MIIDSSSRRAPRTPAAVEPAVVVEKKNVGGWFGFG